MQQQFTVDAQHEKWRLDKYLTEQLDTTRSQIQKMIVSGEVLVNGRAPSKHKFLKVGDTINVSHKAVAATSTHDQETGPTVPAAKKTSWFRRLLDRWQDDDRPQPTIIAENENYLIIEKPSGLLVHPTLRGEEYTLVDALLKKYPGLRKVGEDPVRPGIVHRLDKEVSGLMIIPRNLTAFDHFKKQFKLRTIDKEYQALVHGEIDKNSGRISFPIARSKSGKFVARPIGSGKGKVAETEFQVLQRYLNFTLLKLKPLTGRTNQLRVHLTAFDHPIVGDPLYQKSVKTTLKSPRILLHATKITFTDLDGSTKTFESPLPSVFQNVLAKLQPTQNS